ncbi:alpha/beta fold hydrolase [Nocardia sp. NPDC051832]|uniref:thioesterase II family protein n=1 Tax=Nocardia sp. NPDC051832 TaxID=3155673 RepID=UPI003424A7FC
MTEVDETNRLWIRRFEPVADPQVRLVCLPHAGGSASYFFSTARALAPHYEVLAVQYPGRQDRRQEQPFTSVDELADAIAGQLLAWTDRPLAIFGHSLGAVIGYEVAHRLLDSGREPTTLLVSGRRAPSRTRVEDVHTRSDQGLLDEVAALDGTDPLALADPDMRRMVLTALRADYTAVENYRDTARKPLRLPVYAHIGLDDPRVTVAEAESWAQHTTGRFQLHTYPGGHFYLNAQAAALTANIRQALRDTRPAP